MLTRTFLLASFFATGMFAAPAVPSDRRVVDTVWAGDAESETVHGYAGHDDLTGVSNGQPFRQARGWMRYAMTTFDDTQVTVACTFVSTDTTPLSYDVIVEDSVVATRTFSSTSGASVVVEIAVPFSVTKGRTHIAVVIRGRGGPTPALRELRTIQDHHEVSSVGHVWPSTVAVQPSRSTVAAPSSRSTGAAPSSRSHPLGVAR